MHLLFFIFLSTTNKAAYWAVYVLFHFTPLLVLKEILIPSSITFALIPSFVPVPVDIQHEIQHTKQRFLYFRAFWGNFRRFDSCSKRQHKNRL